MKRLNAFTLGLLLTSALTPHIALAQQPAQVIGPITPGDIPVFNSPTIIKDSGTRLIPNGTQLYASTAGLDANNSCTVSTAPCTLEGACLQRSNLATFLQATTGNVIINIGNGTYSTVDGNNALCTIVGNSGGSSTILTFLVGNVGNPGSVILAIPAGAIGIFTKDLGEADINGITMTGGNGSIGISGSQYSVADIAGISWGAWGTSGVHYNMARNASLAIFAETINSSINTHIESDGANVSLVAVTIPSAVNWQGQFVFSVGPSRLDFHSATFNGPGVAGTTGNRAALAGPGYMTTNGVACASFFPGNGGCIIQLGFMDDAADNQTTPLAVGGVSCTLTTVSHLTVVNGVVTLCN